MAKMNAERIRKGLVKGRIRMADKHGPSPLIPSFHEALEHASIDDLRYVMNLFVRNPQVKRTWRNKRERAMTQRMKQLTTPTP